MLVVLPDYNNFFQNEEFKNSSIRQNYVAHPGVTQKGFSNSKFISL